MASSGLFDKFTNLVRRPPFFILQALLNRIPGRPFQIGHFFLLELYKPALKTIRGAAVIRAGSPADITGMCKLQNKGPTFTRRFKEGEFCAIAVHEEMIIGYLWFSDKAAHLEEHYKYHLTIPYDAIYAYDGFINETKRLSGAWPLLVKFLLDKAHVLKRKKIIAMVAYGNDPSLKAHLRFGFSVYKKVFSIRLFKKTFLYEKSIAPVSFDPGKAIKR